MPISLQGIARSTVSVFRDDAEPPSAKKLGQSLSCGACWGRRDRARERTRSRSSQKAGRREKKLAA
jgi:hypothetical protein